MRKIDYPFLRVAGRMLNAGETRSVLLSGNIHDLYYSEQGGELGSYVPLIDFLLEKWDVPGKILLVYELNGPIRFVSERHREKVKDAWLKWKTGLDSSELTLKQLLSAKMKAVTDSLSDTFELNLQKAIGRPTVALEFLRQLCLCSRTVMGKDRFLNEDLIILVEGADLILPESGGSVGNLSDSDRHRVSVCQDWFSDPGFLVGGDSVVLVTESKSILNERVARLPQVLEVPIPGPDEEMRKHFITWFNQNQEERRKIKLWGSQQDLAQFTGGLTLHALRQLLISACHEDRKLEIQDVIAKVEIFIQAQLGGDVVEFKKPEHTLKDVVGFRNLKKFLKTDLIPRLQSTGVDALPGAAVGGPIGGGKTFIFEAVATELGMVVLVLKNVRSQWFGQTDVIFERFRRVLESLSKVLIFIDEADTQFGGVGAGTHDTERRLTGKIQAMMSDPKLRGRVAWLLMTARIHLLSPDIRRPGRVGDLIIPVLDPEGEDKIDFIKWILKPVLDEKPSEEELNQLSDLTEGYSAAAFSSLRSELIAKAKGKSLSLDDINSVVQDLIPPAIGKTRRYQTLQALVNCTRRSLLPDPETSSEQRELWYQEIERMDRSI